jgi:cytochrome c biogenesis protein CcdA/thiol-disulfide isomerase/thioredoxin
MLTTILFALAGGLLTVLSPCVLPVVPLLVGSSVDPDGSRGGAGRRVAGLILGFGGAFLVTTVVLASTLAAAGVTTAQLRVVSALLLVAFGATLLVPALGRAVERRAAWIARTTSRDGGASMRAGTLAAGGAAFGTGGGGLAGGLALGVLIGLIWSPCVGPIMAAVIATAVTQGPSPDLVIVTLAYVTGAAIPLAAIAFGGRRAVARLGSGLARERLVRTFGAITVAAGLLVATGLDIPLQARIAGLFPAGWATVDAAQPAAAIKPPPSTAATVPEPLLNADGRPLPRPLADALPASVALEDLGPAPELTGITAWINAEPQTLASLRGKVVIVHFWTFGCINCVHVQPYVKDWADRYADAGLVVLGVHTPELSYERDLDNVRDAVDRQGVRFPVAFDPEFASWRAYGNQYWPGFFFIDREGQIRRADAGEGSYDIREQVIRELLAGA